MPRPSRFLLIWAAALLVMLALVAGFNAIINPYEVFAWRRIPGVNEYKPVTKNHVALAKAFQIERARPITVVLGTSRAYVAIDSANRVWPEANRPVYNYGTPKASMSDVLFRELREAWGTGRLRHAVAILDVPTFLEPDPPTYARAERTAPALSGRRRAQPGSVFPAPQRCVSLGRYSGRAG